MRFPLTLAVCILILASCLLGATSSAARTVYVADQFRITVRQSPSQSARITAMLSTGDRLEVLETRKNWLQVRTEKGQTGWILRRFAMERLPRAQVVKRLRNRIETLEQSGSKAKETMAQLQEAKTRLSDKLKATNQTLQQVREKYEKLRSEVPDLPKIKEQLQKTRNQLQDSQAQIKALEEENASLRSRRTQLWFLSGAGVVFISLFLGFILGRRGRKKTRSVYF